MKDPLVIFKVKEELKTMCGQFGLCRKVNMFDGHPKGICSVAFGKPEGNWIMSSHWFNELMTVVPMEEKTKKE